MLFNSLTFFVFFAILVFILSHLNTNPSRKLILLFASCIFYMWWNPALIILIIISTVIDFVLGKKIQSTPSSRKIYLIASMVSNLGLLGLFKYGNFFQENLIFIMGFFGQQPSWTHLNIILPVGISFYTFQTMSYTIDVYRGNLKATSSVLDFTLFVSFFPQLVAGPIVRAADFLPQLDEPKDLSFKKEHFLIILRGLFKKVIIADNLGRFVDLVFQNPETYSSTIIIFAVLCFSVQIYCDFSGYSEMAIGLARILGYELRANFDRPYFSTTPSEFWRKWHISLSGWLRDYLYISLGGSKNGTFMTYRNLMLTMLLGGLWHGASWNFVLWGFLHGAVLVIYRPISKRVDFERLSRPLTLIATLFFQVFILLTWIAFRLVDFGQMALVYQKVLLFDFNFNFASIGLGTLSFFTTFFIFMLFWVLHILSRYHKDLCQLVLERGPLFQGAALFIAGFILYFFWPAGETPFIYFQF